MDAHVIDLLLNPAMKLADAAAEGCLSWVLCSFLEGGQVNASILHESFDSHSPLLEYTIATMTVQDWDSFSQDGTVVANDDAVGED